MDSEKEIIKDDVTELSAQQLDDVTGGMNRPYKCHHDFGPRYKKKSLFGWNWYAVCSKCGVEVRIEEGPWSGSPDDPE